MRRALFLSVLSCVLSPWMLLADDDWHQSLYRSGGGWWSQRIEVHVGNDGPAPLTGWPITLVVGEQPDQIRLANSTAESIRVCDQRGNEMLWTLLDADGSRMTSGPVPRGGLLVLPVECEAGRTARYFVYFGNPSAQQVPDYLQARTDLVNGDVERGQGDTPAGWVHDSGDAEHIASWSNEHPQSGKRCLKTVVTPGAEPTWIATRQQNIAVIGAARYRLTAWVRAANVRGYAGWYLHLGNSQQPMLQAPMLSAGEGTFDWKPVSLEFIAPAEADRLSLGTVLRGTGTAWFDNVRLKRLSEGQIRVAVQAPEERILREEQAPDAWLQSADGKPPRTRRAVVRIVNGGDQAREHALVPVDLRTLRARNRGRLDPQSIVVIGIDGPRRHVVLGDQLLLETKVMPRSVDTCHIYFSPPLDAVPSQTPAASPDELIRSPVNLVKNPNFEDGGEMPDAWTHTGGAAGPDAPRFEIDDPGRDDLGDRCLKMQVPSTAQRFWRGWHQDVPVQPGQTYLLAAWVKCRDVDGEVRIHAHRRQADGQLSAETPYASIGPSISGTTEWTLLSGQLTMPLDTTVLQLHLTMQNTGTLWHDNVLLTPVMPGEVLRVEAPPGSFDGELAIWQVPAVVKVFPEDVPVRPVQPLQIAAARNECEPLQLAIRSSTERQSLRIEMDSLIGPGEFRLDNRQINVVGYVPIDYPTNYYQSETPAWYRKVPDRSPACDGWPGLWPDPLLPTEPFDLPAGVTQPIWITFQIPPDAPPGDYTGRLRLMSNAKILAERPVNLHVWNFRLPDENHVAAIYDVRLGPGGAAQWGKSLDELYPEIIRFMASRRLCPDTIRPTPRFWLEDGQVRADFTEYDRAARVYFDELKFPYAYTPWDFYLFGWGHPPKRIFGQAPYEGEPPFESADRSRLRPEYRRVYQQMLRLYWDHLREQGWNRKIVLYISDEPFDHHAHIRTQMKALCAMIHEVDPEIPIYSSTWHHIPDWDDSLDVWGIGHDGRVPVAKMAELVEAGERIWFTTDGQMCTDTPYCAVERLLPHYCFKHGAQAYEFWGVAWTTYDPFRYGWHAYIHQSSEPGKSYWVRYPNGDGFLLYPGPAIGHQGIVSSIRFEQAREGVEDFEYLYLLRELIEAAQRAGRDTTLARRALADAASLVEIPNAGGRYSTEILPDPDQLYRIRKALATAIENLVPPGPRR